VGLVVPRLRHTAVARNRLKRRLRELARTRLLPSALDADVVIRVRPETYDASFAELQVEMDRVITLIARARSSERRSPLSAPPPDSPSDDTR
jgi:ribonuclease P protein component